MIDQAQTFQQFLTEFWNDTRPPGYSNVFADQIAPTTARINFTCDELSLSQVFVSTSLSVVQAATLQSPGTSLYSTGRWIAQGIAAILAQINLTGLADATTHYYRVMTEDVLGNKLLSQESYSFVTAADPPATISGVTITPTTNSAAIHFDTDEGAQGRVQWGIEAGIYTNATLLDAPGTTSHDHTLTTLDHSTTYYYQIEATDSGSNVSTKTGSFTTVADPVPIISNVNHAGLTRTQITITWNTNEGCTGQVQWSSTSGTYSNVTAETTALTLSHSHTITGLSASTTYYYRCRVKDSVGQVVYSGQGSFTTIGNPYPVGYSSANNGGGSSTLTLPVPSGVQQDDILIAAVAVHGGAGSNTPSVWERIAHSSYGGEDVSIYRRKYNSGDGSYAFGLTSSAKANGGIAAYRNVNVSNPVNNSNTGSGGTTSRTVSCNGPGSPTYYFAACGVNADEGLSVSSGGFTERFEPRSTRNALGADKSSSSSSESVTFEIGTSVNHDMAVAVCSLNPI